MSYEVTFFLTTSQYLKTELAFVIVVLNGFKPLLQESKSCVLITTP